MARKTFAERRKEKLAELDRIKDELSRIETRTAERIGKLAIRSGLADIEIDEESLAKELAAVAAKFSAKKAKPIPSPETEARND